MDKEFLDKEYKTFHAKGKFGGGALAPYIEEIKELIKKHNCMSLLDYGCGKARLHKKNKLAHEVVLYDPYYEPYSKIPIGGYDMVICTDVLEHIPENEVGKTIAQLLDYTNKILFLSISIKPAIKKFSNGTNVHITIKPKEWWEDMLKTAQNIEIVRHYT